MTKQLAKKRRMDAERAAEHCLHECFGCAVTVRAVRTQWQRQDLFGCDVVGKTSDGSHVYAQATAGQHSAVTSRRRKLEAIPWHAGDTVLVLRLIESVDPANGRRKVYHFRVHELTGGEWRTREEAIPVPREWFNRRCELRDRRHHDTR